MKEILSFVFKDLKKRLKNRQTCDAGQKQGKFRRAENFSANLSTETVDFFPLASGPLSLQRQIRIDVSKRPLFA